MTHSIGNIIKDFNLGPKGRALLAKHPSGGKDFDLDCARWMMTSISDYHKRPIPTIPVDLSEYYRKKKDDYKYTVHSDFFKQPHVAEYMATASAVECENKKNEHWLKFIRNTIPVDDIEAHKKINEMLSTYGVERKYIPPELAKAQEIFGAAAACPKDKDDPDGPGWNY
jgi:hypothetical protein